MSVKILQWNYWECRNELIVESVCPNLRLYSPPVISCGSEYYPAPPCFYGNLHHFSFSLGYCFAHWRLIIRIITGRIFYKPLIHLPLIGTSVFHSWSCIFQNGIALKVFLLLCYIVANYTSTPFAFILCHILSFQLPSQFFATLKQIWRLWGYTNKWVKAKQINAIDKNQHDSLLEVQLCLSGESGFLIAPALLLWLLLLFLMKRKKYFPLNFKRIWNLIL